MKEKTIFEIETGKTFWKITEKEGSIPLFNRLNIWIIDKEQAMKMKDEAVHIICFPFFYRNEDETGILYLIDPKEKIFLIYFKEKGRKTFREKIEIESEIIMIASKEEENFANIIPLIDILDGKPGIIPDLLEAPDSLNTLKELINKSGVPIEIEGDTP